jgi:hypothetical protein
VKRFTLILLSLISAAVAATILFSLYKIAMPARDMNAHGVSEGAPGEDRR